jgi:hypothetical protein
VPVNATVVAEVNAKVPVALPLNGTESEAKATGAIETIARTVKMLGIRSFMRKGKGARVP